MRVPIPTPHGDVAGERVGDGRTGIVLAHGAGAGQDHPWVVDVRDRLADRGFAVLTFDYAYMSAGRRAPDRLPKLVDVHAAAAGVLAAEVDRVVLAGKSMGGRVGGHLVAEGRFAAAGLVYLGYPLVALGSSEPRPTDHLAAVEAPQLFVSGDRDRMGPTDLIRQVAASVPAGRVVIVPSGDHSLVPLKASGRTLEDSLDAVTDEIAAWIGTEVD